MLDGEGVVWGEGGHSGAALCVRPLFESPVV